MFDMNAPSIRLSSRPNTNKNYFELGYENSDKFIIVAFFKLKDGLPVFL